MGAQWNMVGLFVVVTLMCIVNSGKLLYIRSSEKYQVSQYSTQNKQ